MDTEHNSSSPSLSRTSAKISPQLHRKLDRYLLACSATSVAVVAGGVHQSKAAIIYSGTQNIAIPVENISGIYFDFDTNTHTTTSTPASDANLFDGYGSGTYNGNTAFYHAVSFFGPNTGDFSLATMASTTGETLRLSSGTTIGASSSTFGTQNDLINRWYNASGTAISPLTGQWATGGTGFIGFKFKDANGQTDFGWMRVSINVAAFTAQDPSMPSATVIDWAFNNAGGSILAGQVPEPSTIALALLGAGAVGLVIWRQRRQQQSSTPEA